MFKWIKSLLPKQIVYEPELKWTNNNLNSGYINKHAISISKAFKDAPEYMEALTYELMCALDVAGSPPIIIGTQQEIDNDRRKREHAAIRADAFRYALRLPIISADKVKKAIKKDPEKVKEYTPWVPK